MSPRWSPDGTRLAYVSAAEGSPQLYVRWMDSGQTALLTNLVQAPGAIAWSPDGKSIAFTQLVPAKKPPLATPPEKPEGAQWAPPVKVIDSVVYRADGEGYLESGYQHVFVVSAEGGTPRQLTEGEFNDDGPLSFTPDSKRIVFSANRGADWERDPQESEVFTVDIATAEAHAAHHARRPGQLARGVAGRPENRLPGLRRPPAGLPGHSSICDGHRRKELARSHGRPSTATWRNRAGRPTAAACISRMTNAACESLEPPRSTARCARWRTGSAAPISAARIPRAASAWRAMAAPPSRTTPRRVPRTSPPWQVEVHCACSRRSTTTCWATRSWARCGNSPGSPRRISARSRAG